MLTVIYDVHIQFWPNPAHVHDAHASKSCMIVAHAYCSTRILLIFVHVCICHLQAHLVVKALMALVGCGLEPSQIGVICFYKAQVRMMMCVCACVCVCVCVVVVVCVWGGGGGILL